MNAFKLRQAAITALQSNDSGSYTYPARSDYPHQWNFPSALSALGWAVIDPARAYTELESLTGMANEQGMLTHLAYEHGARGYTPRPQQWGELISADGRRCSGITHPPVAATCLRLIFEYAPDQRALPLLTRLHAWHTFLLTERNFLGSNEPVLVHPWESVNPRGREYDETLARINGVNAAANSDFNDKLRQAAALTLIQQGEAAHWQQFALANKGSFRVLDPGFSAILAGACQDLTAVAQALGEESIAAESQLLAFNVASALNARASVDGFVRVHDATSQKDVEFLSPGTALAVLSPSLPAATITSLRYLLSEGELASPFGVLSNSTSSRKSKNPPAVASPSATWLCALGLERHGERAAAELLRQRLLASVNAGGLRENYDATTGSGKGVQQFAPTAALALWEYERESNRDIVTR
jgi:hypothetical protein